MPKIADRRHSPPDSFFGNRYQSFRPGIRYYRQYRGQMERYCHQNIVLLPPPVQASLSQPCLKKASFASTTLILLRTSLLLLSSQINCLSIILYISSPAKRRQPAVITMALVFACFEASSKFNRRLLSCKERRDNHRLGASSSPGPCFCFEITADCNGNQATRTVVKISRFSDDSRYHFKHTDFSAKPTCRRLCSANLYPDWIGKDFCRRSLFEI